jgi:hypothetical protein
VTQTALIVVDTLNRYDHETENARGVRPQTLPHIVDLRDQAQRRDDVLLVYVNDNRDAEPEALVEHALSGGHPELVEPIAPTDPVPFLPKGRHSIFYQTPLDHLLRVENVERLVHRAGHRAVHPLLSARRLPTRVPARRPTDAVVHIYEHLAQAALEMMERNMHADLTPAADVF